MTPLEAVNELAAMSLHKDFWKPYRFLDDNTFLFNDWMREIRPLSAGLLVLFLVLEIIRRQQGELRGESPMGTYATFIWASLLGAFLTVPGLYFEGIKTCIEVASSLSNSIHNADLDAMDMEISNLMKGILASTLNPVALMTAFLELLTPIGLLTVVGYYLVIAILYALPYVQSLYIAVFVFLGPILLPFAIFAPMRAVARKWFLSVLGASFISVFGIIAYTAISVSGILTNLAMAGDKHVPSLVYSFVTLAFLLSVVWSSFRLFGAISLSVQQGWNSVAAPLKKLGGM